eukprot:3120841-Prymnesium_polylepis.1
MKNTSVVNFAQKGLNRVPAARGDAWSAPDCVCVCYGPTGRGVCYGPTGRGTQTGHTSGTDTAGPRAVEYTDTG